MWRIFSQDNRKQATKAQNFYHCKGGYFGTCQLAVKILVIFIINVN